MSFKEMLRLRISATATDVIPSDWIVNNTMLRKVPYSFVDHEYQIDFVNDKHRIVTAKKCAQIGFTEILLRWMLCFLVQHQGSQTIFTQPTDTDVGKFAKSRVDVLFEDCEIIKRLGTGGIDSAYLKRVGHSFLNLRGTFGTKAAISVPSDANVYDEIDFSNPRVLSQFKSRLQHSKYKFERLISTPTIPNYGVSALYNQSDQKRVILKCNHCGHYQFLTWEKHVWIRHITTGKAVRKDPDAINAYIAKPWEFMPFVACEKCDREVDRSWHGGCREWVAEYPERAQDLDNGISGYHISQLDVPFVNVSDIVKASDKRFPEGYKKEQDFDNFVLGKESSGGEGMKIDDSVKELSTIRMDMPQSASGTFIGVDLGNTCNIVVVKDFWLPGHDNRVPVVIAAYTIPKEQLEYLGEKDIDRYRALYTVSDAQPYTTDVSKIANKDKYKGRMKICYFGGKKAYTTSDIIVTANRTQMLDMVTDDLPRGDLLVSDQVPEEFWDHVKNLVKVKVEDDEDGTVYYEYVKVGDDHYGFALGYAMLARKLFFELKPTGQAGIAPVEISGHRTTL